MLPSNGTSEIPTISSACLNTKEDDPIPDLSLPCLFSHHSSWKGHSLETKPHGAGPGMWLWKWRSLLLILLLLLCIFSIVNIASLVCKAWPGGRRMMRVIFLFILPCGISCWRGSGASGSSGASQQDVDPGAELVFQHQLGWHHWVCPSSGLSGSLAVFWKCYPCREFGIGVLSPLPMEREMWSRCGCHSPCWQHLFLKTILSSAQLHPEIFPSKQNSHPSKILLF